MRSIITPIILAAALSGCGPSSLQQGVGSTPLGSRGLAQALTGMTAGSPVSCLPVGPTWRSERLTDDAIAYRTGGRLFVSTFEGSCSKLGRPGYALVTTIRGDGICSGDVAQIMDTTTRMIVDQCVLGPFVPYDAFGRWN